MQILNASEQLLTALMLPDLPDKLSGDPASYSSFVMDQYEQCLRNLEHLSLPEEIIQEAKYILTVFADERMMTEGRVWELQQLANYGSNCGGEEFFIRLEALLDRYSVMDAGAKELLTLYNCLLALGFRGSFWNDPDHLAKLRSRMNGILEIPSRIVLINDAEKVRTNRYMSHLDRSTIVAAVLMLLIFVFALLCLNDYLSGHAEIWEGVRQFMDSKAADQMQEALKR